jgi:cbb3-type cytochrome oxidase subunit 3
MPGVGETMMYEEQLMGTMPLLVLAFIAVVVYFYTRNKSKV